MYRNMFLSLLVQSGYVALTGITLVFKPNMLLELFGFEPTHEIWIKVTGILVFSLAILYMSIRRENRRIAMATVVSRIFIAACFGLLVAFCDAKPALMLFAGFDVLTAVWTWRELQHK
jgi:CHASE2 domain-containing sensor protein